MAELVGQGWTLDVYLSPWAEKMFGAARFRDLARRGEFHTDATLTNSVAQVERVNAVAVPVLTRNTASKVALLISDSLSADLIIQALLQGKPVVAALDAVEAESGLSSEAGAAAPSALVRLAESYLRVLRDMGVELVPAAAVGERLRWKLERGVAASRAASGRRMVVTVADLEELAKEGPSITLPADAIVTAAAWDRARELGLQLVLKG